MTRPSLRDAIDAKCKSCIYDPKARGNWREQVQECSSANCSLRPVRPISGGSKRAELVEPVLGPACLVSRYDGSKNDRLAPPLGKGGAG